MLDDYLTSLNVGYYEVTFAFEGLTDEHVWKRPAATLLSIGELAGQIAFWEAVRLAGEGANGSLEPDLSKCKVKSPLIDHRFAYYPITLASQPAEHHLAMTAEQVCKELIRVHEESVAHLKALNPDPKSCAPGWGPEWSYEEFVKYLAFHVAYHVGQMYSVRHLLGDTTSDN